MRLPLPGSFVYRLKAGASEPTTSLNSWLAAALSRSVKSNTWPGCTPTVDAIAWRRRSEDGSGYSLSVSSQAARMASSTLGDGP
ncbi:hypothetical protein G6F68_020248 [Rhizopus microsporus]|nr:hypothetical protein G6F68_020248 [Rhizopus microsporus]